MKRSSSWDDKRGLEEVEIRGKSHHVYPINLNRNLNLTAAMNEKDNAALVTNLISAAVLAVVSLQKD